MTSFFNQLFTPTTGEDALVKVLLTLLILVFGHLGVKLFSMMVRAFWIENKEGLTKKNVRERHEALQYLSYVLDAAVIVFALLYLNTGLTAQISKEFVQFLPQLLSVVLIGILGFIAINLSIKVGSEFLKTIGIQSYFQEVGLSRSALNVIAGLVKAFLYLLLLQIAMSQLGIGDTFVDELVNASSWAIAFLVAGLLFYGFKDLFQNFAAGVYLKNSRLVRPGEEVKLGEETGEIRDIALFSTTVSTDSGYTLLSPNKRVMESDIRFKRTKNDIETLEDIKNHFVAQNPDYCGPASMEMALDILGYQNDQEEIGKKSEIEDGGAKPAKLMDAVEDLTEKEVRTGFVPVEKIADIGDEFKAWFNDGALIVPHFDKPTLFPEAESGNYVLSVGAEDEEMLIIDPNSDTGGVYYVDKSRLYDAMAQHPEGGYIVIAPEGTTAHWRIKNDLLYSEKTHYDELSKTLENRMRKILRQGRLLSDVMPPSLEKYMEKWRSGEPVTRIWGPETGEEDEASDDS
ncbi:MAG: mechanosensitive ion channel domain-containing protein [Candidatus Nanohaloarchaea archaeon]